MNRALQAVEAADDTFGLWCALPGYLIFRSTFMPRVIGVWLIIDGVGWMLYLWPPLATFLYPAIASASALAEIPLLPWLLAFGVNTERWNEQAQAQPGVGALSPTTGW